MRLKFADHIHMNTALCQAIREKKVISFYYLGGVRSAEPHCYGVSKEENELLRAYQIGGHSESGNPIGWKLLRLDELSNLQMTNQHFAGPRPQYNPEDKAMARVICCL
jgi:hypothetical protein